MDRLIRLAAVCNETKGASFSLTRTKAKMWTIHFPNKRQDDKGIGVKVVNADLGRAVQDAITYLLQNRKEVTTQVLKYEL